MFQEWQLQLCINGNCFGCICDQGIDKKKIKTRLTSKKKMQPESSAEKCDLSPASEVSVQSVASSLNSAELCELHELLRQKRSQLELQQDEKPTAVAVTGDLDVQPTEAVLTGVCCFLLYQRLA